MDAPKPRRVRVAKRLEPGGRTARGELGDLYERVAPLAFQRSLATLGDPSAAEDVVQDAFLALLEREGDVQDAVRSVVSRARNLAYEQTRRRRAAAGGAAAQAPPADPASLAEARALLSAVWQGMTPTERSYVAHMIAGYSFDEAAAHHGRAPGTASANIAHARARARAIRERILADDVLESGTG